MRLKELKKENNNLLDFIKYFDGLENTNNYWNELVYLYGNRTLLEPIQELFTVEGLGGIGFIFDLKSKSWEDFKIIGNLIQKEVALPKTVTHTKDNVGSINREKTSNNTDNTTEGIIPYDEVEETERDKINKTGTITDNETIGNTDTGTTKSVYSGYDKDRLNFLYKTLKDYPEYRYYIYNDIVNMLCLQVYDLMI